MTQQLTKIYDLTYHVANEMDGINNLTWRTGLCNYVSASVIRDGLLAHSFSN